MRPIAARRRALLRAAAAALLCALAGCAGEAPPPPNVVIVLHDTLRPDHLGFHGYGRETAPFLAQVAARGAVFPRAYSSSAWTVPATASVFTGLYPTGHGMVQGFEVDGWVAEQLAVHNAAAVEVTRLPEDQPTLSERFQAAGYATFCIATNTHVSEDFGYDRGFDSFSMRRNASAASVVDDLIARRAELLAEGRPYFLYLHLNDVHKPYQPHAPWYRPGDDQRAELVARYDSEISYLDAELRRLAEAYRWEENTLVCLISDHGEAFQEHGVYGHQKTLHAELNRVLMVFAGPGVAPGTVGANASLVDVAPTLLELIGAAPAKMHGTSLAGLLDADRRAAEEQRLAGRPLFAHRLGVEAFTLEQEMKTGHLWSVQRGPWRLIRDEVADRTMLFDLDADPLEQRDLYAAEPERAAELEGLLERFAAGGIREPGEKARIAVDEALYEDLKTMGYAGDG